MAETYFGKLSRASPGTQLQHLIAGYWVSQAIAVAAQLGLADLLAGGPKPSTELAEATGTHPRALYRLLRALASVGVFTEVEPGTFGLTPMAELLRSDAAVSLRGMAVYVRGEEHWRTWGQLGYSVRSGQSAFKHLFGMDPWAYRERHPEANAAFNAFMTSLVTQVADAVAEAYDFSGSRTVVDVGGSHGALLVAILRANPGLRGVLFDLPHVAEGAEGRLGAAGLLERCEVVGGDMFEGVPVGGDIYILSRVIHDWDDERSSAILQNCRRAMAPSGKLLLAEEVIPVGDTPSYGKLSDLHMLVSPGGQERTEAEYRTLYEAAGFTLRRVIPTRSRVSVIEGTPI
jgi:SAM-dependent methyltransferase